MCRILIVILISICTPCFAQKQVKADTAQIEKRLINADALKRIKADKEFQYDRYKEPPKSLWDRFWSWFWFKISQLLSTKGGRTTMWTVFIVIGVATITYFVLKVMGMNKGGLFGRSSKESLNYTISSDDIHGISFEEAIQQAIASSNFRLAIRLLYLQSLKKLSDSGYINWQLNKTNTDYLQETRDKKWHSLFSSLTYNFEYTWYGETPINKERFNVVQEQFTQFNNQL
jgi:hypothetical protein